MERAKRRPEPPEVSEPDAVAFGMLDHLLESPALRPLRRGQLLIALTIYSYAYLAPAPLGGRVAPFGDRGLHAMGTALLFLSLWVATTPRMKLWMMILLACAVSFGLEYAQSFSAIRHFDLADLGANAVGVMAGAGIIAACRRLARLKRK